MQVPKQYFQDRVALVLSSLSLLLVIATIAVVLIRLTGGGGSFIIGYRADLGIEAFKSGGLSGILSFLVFAVVVFAVQTLLCWRTYLIQRRLAIGVLASGLFLILLNLVVCNSLLALH